MHFYWIYFDFYAALTHLYDSLSVFECVLRSASAALRNWQLLLLSTCWTLRNRLVAPTSFIKDERSRAVHEARGERTRRWRAKKLRKSSTKLLRLRLIVAHPYGCFADSCSIIFLPLTLSMKYFVTFAQVLSPDIVLWKMMGKSCGEFSRKKVAAIMYAARYSRLSGRGPVNNTNCWQCFLLYSISGVTFDSRKTNKRGPNSLYWRIFFLSCKWRRGNPRGTRVTTISKESACVHFAFSSSHSLVLPLLFS